MLNTTTRTIRQACEAGDFAKAAEIVRENPQYNPKDIKRTWKTNIVAALIGRTDQTEEAKNATESAVERLNGQYAYCAQCGLFQPFFQEIQPSKFWRYPLHRQLCKTCDEVIGSQIVA